MSQYVKIHYGPYEAFHTTSHKPEKLKGVRDKLRRLGYRVDLNPVEYIDYCVFEILGYQSQYYVTKMADSVFAGIKKVFRCNIRNLQLNREADHDPVATRAVQACLVATDKLQRARCYFYIRQLIDNAVFERTTYQDQWPFQLDLKPYGTCMHCVRCCGVLTEERADCEKGEALSYREIKQKILYDLASKNEPKEDK